MLYDETLKVYHDPVIAHFDADYCMVNTHTITFIKESLQQATDENGVAIKNEDNSIKTVIVKSNVMTYTDKLATDPNYLAVSCILQKCSLSETMNLCLALGSDLVNTVNHLMEIEILNKSSIDNELITEISNRIVELNTKIGEADEKITKFNELKLGEITAFASDIEKVSRSISSICSDMDTFSSSAKSVSSEMKEIKELIVLANVQTSESLSSNSAATISINSQLAKCQELLLEFTASVNDDIASLMDSHFIAVKNINAASQVALAATQKMESNYSTQVGNFNKQVEVLKSFYDKSVVAIEMAAVNVGNNLAPVVNNMLTNVNNINTSLGNNYATVLKQAKEQQYLFMPSIGLVLLLSIVSLMLSVGKKKSEV